MHIFIKFLTGKTLTFKLHSNDTVKIVKDNIKDKENVLIDNKILIFKGKKMDNLLSLKKTQC
uniref:Ubiquitin family n=1 Tax=Mimiviridae sp. ChoanoV1 TaxID=2596887 RepID=A0A5B8IG19_9VIRU|nr:ubiquitin family [Mimiviridae sp. ChoanoV1]